MQQQFFRNLKHNDTDMFEEYPCKYYQEKIQLIFLDYSVCWGEKNFLKSFKSPIVFNGLSNEQESEPNLVRNTLENGLIAQEYSWIFEEKFEPETLMRDDEGNFSNIGNFSNF